MGGERYILTCKVDEQLVVQEIVDSEFLKRGYSIAILCPDPGRAEATNR